MLSGAKEVQIFPVHQIINLGQKALLRIGLNIIPDVTCILPVQTTIFQYDHPKKDANFKVYQNSRKNPAPF